MFAHMDLDGNGFIAKRKCPFAQMSQRPFKSVHYFPGELRKALQRLGTGADQDAAHELLAELRRCAGCDCLSQTREVRSLAQHGACSTCRRVFVTRQLLCIVM